MSLKKVKIKSKKNIGIKPVYDISVPNAHHYLLDSGIVSHNSGFIYASSIVVAMDKLKLKKDADGNKTSQVHGIRAKCKVMKTRYSKPFEQVELEIPYETGLDEFSGFFEYILSKGVIEKTGNKYLYYDKDGNGFKYFEKQIVKNENGICDLILSEWDSIKDKKDQVLEDEDTETNSSITE